MRILKVEPGQPAYEKEIENTLRSIQAEVDGFFETILLDDETYLCCNDESKLIGKEPNRRLMDDIICGPFFIVGYSGENFTSLTDEQVTKYLEQFGEPEQFQEHEPNMEPHIIIISF
ncbi:MAG: DUF3846 domain-containing protein [Oscillospiraceae bacterium]|nr:DUF3846 domain-containing protein [Oscillospiraceae bacterium]